MAHGPLHILSLLLFSQYNLSSILTKLFNNLLTLPVCISMLFALSGIPLVWGKPNYLLRPCYLKSGLLTTCVMSPGSLLEIQNLKLYSRPLTQNQHFQGVPRGFSGILRMETHYIKPSPSSASLESLPWHALHPCVATSLLSTFFDAV